MLYLSGAISFGDFYWVELIYAAIGSFIGIFVPMWIDKLRARKQEREERRKLVSSLEKELSSVKDLIVEYSKPSHQNHIFSFTTFVWDSVVSAGMLPEMLSDEEICCESLIEIYSKLALLRDMHDDFSRCETREELERLYGIIRSGWFEIAEAIEKYQNQVKTR